MNRELYLDTQDTIAEVGITRRQLSYWREKGVFTPQFGPNAKRFTILDISVLHTIKRLVGDLGMSVECAKILIESVDSVDDSTARIDESNARFIDLKNTRLVGLADLILEAL